MHAGAWAAATAAAVTLSWFGVRSVLRSTAYDPPRAMPITTTLPPQISATQRPSPRPGTTGPSPSPTPRHTATGTPRPSASATTTRAPAPTTPAAPTSPASSGEVHAYTVGGGRVVLSLDADAASLVSATPESGWQMSVWTPYADQWLRVTFTSASGDRASTVSCTWNGHPPEVTTYEN
jgi:hypothetical protein